MTLKRMIERLHEIYPGYKIEPIENKIRIGQLLVTHEHARTIIQKKKV